MSTAKFRGNWAPKIADPNPPKFFKVAPPARPAVKKTDPAPPPLPPRPPQTLDGPDRPCKFNIRDRANDYRGLITDDGDCYNNAGEIIGFISGDEAGSPEMEYLGCIRSDDVIENAVGDVVGSLDTGRAYILNAAGSTVCEILGTGELHGHANTYLGQFEPFSYHDMKTIALYVLLVDTGMLSEIEG